jgi:hypothetical protein
VNSAWSNLTGADWISVANTGNPSSFGFVTEPNGFNATFTDTFTVPAGVTTATLYVLADDTTSVYLNGTLVAAAAGAAGEPYTTCSKVPIGCLTSTEGVFDLTGLTASDTLEFDPTQMNGSSYGLDFVVVATPEPGTLALLASGLLAMVFLTFRKSRVSSLIAC